MHSQHVLLGHMAELGLGLGGDAGAAAEGFTRGARGGRDTGRNGVDDIEKNWQRRELHMPTTHSLNAPVDPPRPTRQMFNCLSLLN